MMNVAVLEGGNSSECSSGCESGWTLYLEHSNNSNFTVSSNKKGRKNSCHFRNNSNSICKQQKILSFDDVEEEQNHKKNNGFYSDEDDDEDLSMVSDASSGPPHFDHDIDDDEVEVEEFFSTRKRQQSMKLSSSSNQQFFDFGLDDTASSPNFISKNNVGENNGASLKRMIDYSSQGFSATHLNQGRSNNFQGHYGFIQPRFSTKQFQPNQWS